MTAVRETTAQRAHRLLSAAEDLLAEQRQLLAGDDAGELAATTARLAPLITGLCALAADPLFPADAHDRVRALQRQLLTDGDQLATRLTAISSELTALRASERRIGRLAPAYRHPQEDATETPAFRMQA